MLCSLPHLIFSCLICMQCTLTVQSTALKCFLFIFTFIICKCFLSLKYTHTVLYPWNTVNFLTLKFLDFIYVKYKLFLVLWNRLNIHLSVVSFCFIHFYCNVCLRPIIARASDLRFNSLKQLKFIFAIPECGSQKWILLSPNQYIV